MPYPNEHAARLINPNRFEKGSFRRKQIKDGVSIIIGKLEGQDKTTAQAYRFDKKMFTADEAKKWLADNDVKYISFEKAIQAFISLQAFKQEFGKRYLEFIDPKTFREIKSKDPKPYFQIYSICHEGVSNPKILDAEKEVGPIRWTRRAVQSIKNIITKGVKFFFRHNKDNSTEGRKVLGEIVGDGQEEIGGKLHHIAVGYFPPETREEAKNYNICSQEGEWNFFEKAGKLFAHTIDKLTGIALDNSENDKPAFKDAKRLCIVQAFNKIQAESQEGEKKNMSDLLEKLTFNQIKDLVKDRKFFPSQLFTIDEIKGDREFVREFEIIDNLKKDLEGTKEKIKSLETEKIDLVKNNLKSTAKDRLNGIINNEKLKLTDRQKKFIDLNFNPEMEDLSDESLNGFVNKQLDIYKKSATVFGVKDDEPVNQGSKDTTKDPSNLNKTENNEFLKNDLE